MIRLVCLALLCACSPSKPAAPAPKPSPKNSVKTAYINQLIVDCLNRSELGEEDSRLWARLTTWAFAQEMGKAPTPAQIEDLLDAAHKAVPELKTPADWRSAGRYFQAENFHALAPAACRRGIATR